MVAAARLNAVTRVAAGIIGAGMVLVGATSCGVHSAARTSQYCATLPDAVGLYVGNPVTQMGYPLGTVDKITARPTTVQVDFSVSDSRPLPKDVKVVIRSDSILADRALELVGNYESGPRLDTGDCVPLSRSATPKSLSEVIGSTDTFLNGINPQNSSNVGDVVNNLAAASRDVGPSVNAILTTTSRLLDNPDAQISDLGSITNNLAIVSKTLVELRDPMKQILNDSVITTPDIREGMSGAKLVINDLEKFLVMAGDVETHAGEALQLTLDAVSDVVRINTPHAPGWLSIMGGILKPLPWWINAAANHLNNHQFHLFIRPPLYRIRTPDGPLVCAIMNSSMPGSCANVAGQPYGVDINLLQYVFMNASQ